MGNAAYLAIKSQKEANEKAVEESTRAASKDGAPPTTAQDVEVARRYYVRALDQLHELLDPTSEVVLRHKNTPHVPGMREHQAQVVAALRLTLEEVRDRYEAQERQKARDADAELAKASHELAKEQTEAARAQVTIARGAKHAAWFAGIATAAAAIAAIAALVQSFRH